MFTETRSIKCVIDHESNIKAEKGTQYHYEQILQNPDEVETRIANDTYVAKISMDLTQVESLRMMKTNFKINRKLESTGFAKISLELLARHRAQANQIPYKYLDGASCV